MLEWAEAEAECKVVSIPNQQHFVFQLRPPSSYYFVYRWEIAQQDEVQISIRRNETDPLKKKSANKLKVQITS